MYHIKSVQQYLTSELTLTLNWISMFNEDFSTVTIFKGLITGILLIISKIYIYGTINGLTSDISSMNYYLAS